MKKSLPFVLFILLTGIYSCDYISDPYEKLKPDVDGSLCPEPVFPKHTAHRIVLVEDYTGHQCTACPQAAIAAAELEKTFKDSVIILAVHAGHFAEVKKPTYPEDFTTDAGKVYNDFIDFQGYPNGLVNRIGFPNDFVKSYGSWSGEVRKELRLPIEADLQLTSNYNAADGNVCVGVKTTFQSTSVPAGVYKMCLLLIQDSITAPQLNGGVVIQKYVHRHMLRDNINGTWGDTISKGPVTLEPIIKKYRYNVKKDYKGIVCVPKDCHLIAFLFDEATYRILQAAEIKLIE